MSERLDEAVKRLAQRAAVMNVALSMNGPAAGLEGLIRPVIDAAEKVLAEAHDAATYTGTEGKAMSPGVEDLMASTQSTDPMLDAYKGIDRDDYLDFVNGRGRWAEEGDDDDRR